MSKKELRQLEIKIRSLDLGEFILKTKGTVRSVAKYFNIPKSTVHNYLTNILKEVDFEMYKAVQTLFANNLKHRHIRGGDATKLKFLKRAA